MPDNVGAESRGSLLTATLRLTAAMAREENTRALLQEGLRLCGQVLDCERSLIIAQGPDGAHQIMDAHPAQAADALFSTTALRLVNEKNEPLLISDTFSDKVLGAQQSIASQAIRSVVCARLDSLQHLFAGTTLFLYCDSHTHRRPLTPADLETFGLLCTLVANLVRKSDLLAEKDAAINALRSRMQHDQFEELVYASESFQRCIKLVQQAGGAEVPLLLIGETGTGKEALARIAHKSSPRRDRPFFAVNCGAIPSNLIESELFGHEKGAFTGAVAAKKGYFEEADGGTLFLDEVGELPQDVQTHFLRVLQEGEIVRVGSTRPIKVNVRIVSATNANLEKAASENAFRKDLYYRLNVFPVQVPALRERGEDALLLANFFLRKYAETYGSAPLKFSRDCEKAILVYHWPGNVREMQNKVQRAVITSTQPTLSRSDLGLQDQGGPAYASLYEAREAVDREMIAHAMSRSQGNLTNAAKILGIDRKSLRILLEKYGIKPE